MGLLRLDLSSFRIFASTVFEPDPGATTVIVGPNGTGKTSILEAVGYLGTGRSFRGSTREAMVSQGASHALLRAWLEVGGREVQIEAEMAKVGRSKVLINRQPARSRRDLAEAVAVSTFSPEDLVVVRGGPAGRRDLLDDALSLLQPSAGGILEDVDRALRQRSALLRQCRGRLSSEAEATLEVWDDRLGGAGQKLIELRRGLCHSLEAEVERAYQSLAGDDAQRVQMHYQCSAEGGLLDALRRARVEDVRRGVSTVGPHRDDLQLTLNGREARSQASQGEQRCLALSLRLGVHRLVTAQLGHPPILLLDDVFSELDPERSLRLITELPPGQTLITSAVPLPRQVEAASVVDIAQLRGHHG